MTWAKVRPLGTLLRIPWVYSLLSLLKALALSWEGKKLGKVSLEITRINLTIVSSSAHKRKLYLGIRSLRSLRRREIAVSHLGTVKLNMVDFAPKRETNRKSRVR